MRFSVLIFFILILSCASRIEPEWLKTQPQKEDFWFGIGIIEKPYYGDDCREGALNKALAEISAQISVDISTSFERVVKEHNLTLDEFTKSIMQTRIDKNLPYIEIIDFYDSKERCGLLAHLSQLTYYQTIELQRHNAVKSALGFLTQAESDFNIQTFTYLNEALSEILPYMDVPIEKEYPLGSGRIVNLYSYIKLMANSSLNRINLVPDKKTVEMKLGFSRDLKLSVQVWDNKHNTPIENIPIICYIDNKEHGSFALSGTEGNCIFPVPAIRNKKSIQFINFEVNMDEILKNSQLFGSQPRIQSQSILQVNPPKIYIQIIENNLGEPKLNPYIRPVVTEYFAQHFSANFVDNNNADLVIHGMVNTHSISDMPNDYGIYQVLGDMTISISIGETGEELLEKSFNKIQGSAFQSNREAANQSLKKMSETIAEEFLPGIVELIKGLK